MTRGGIREVGEIGVNDNEKENQNCLWFIAYEHKILIV